MFRFGTQFTVVSLVGALFGCGGSGGYGSMGPGNPPPPPPPGNTVQATNALVFTPATLDVSAGQTVTFSFGSVAHNIFFTAQAGAPANIPGNNASVSVNRVFAMQGNYTYTCQIHPQMHGTVVVQ